MFNKIFSIKEDEFHYKIKLLGITFKFRSSKLIAQKLKLLLNSSRTDLMNFNQSLLWGHEAALTYNQKKWFLEMLMYEHLGYFPNLKNPKTFNEKLNWLKLNYDAPNEKICIDKYEFKNYIKEKLGNGYTIPLIGVYEDVNDIDFDSLPQKFVAKSTLEGGGVGVYAIKNKSKINVEELKYKLNNLLIDWHTGFYSVMSRVYEGLKPRIIIEEYMEQMEGQLYDYKFFCFHGEPKIMYVAIDHFPGVKSKISLYDINCNKLNISYDNHPGIKGIIRPKNLDKMIELSKILSKDFPFVRVDFYEIEDKVYIGEMTFTPGGGLGKYDPVDWDYKLGKWLDLTKLNKDYLSKV